MGASTDIDIDFADRNAALAALAHTPASMQADDGRKRHPTGVYFQAIPTDPLDGLAAYDFREAGAHGYFKLDFLNNGIYAGVRDEAHLDALAARTPEWSLFEHPDIVGLLNHVRGNFDAVQAIRPQSVLDLAVVLALIRPTKRRLIGSARAVIDAEIWKPTAEGYAFKKSHAIAYALSIVVQLNLLCEVTCETP